MSVKCSAKVGPLTSRLVVAALLCGCVLPDVNASGSVVDARDASVIESERADRRSEPDRALSATTDMASAPEGGGAPRASGSSGGVGAEPAAGAAGSAVSQSMPTHTAPSAASAGASASVSPASTLPLGAGVDGWNAVPGWNAENYPTLDAKQRRSITVVPSGDSGFDVGAAFAIRQGSSDSDPCLDVVEIRNAMSTERCSISAVVSWPDGAASSRGGFTERLYGSIRIKGTDAPTSSCLAPKELGYFIIREDVDIQGDSSITALHLAVTSVESTGYSAPGFRLVPSAFVTNTVHFINTGTAPAPITYANRIAQLILTKAGVPLGASAGAAGYGIHGPTTVMPGAEVTYEMPKLIPRVVGEADRMLVLVAEY